MAGWTSWLWPASDNAQKDEGEPEADENESNPQDVQTLTKPLKYGIDEKVEESQVEARDGVMLKVRVIPGRPGPSNGGKGKVMLLASPLGFSNLYIFRPLIAHFGTEFTYVNWDYRGIFQSHAPKRLRRCSIRDQAEDALDVLQGLGFSHADVMVGHSMGVAVTCEFTLLYPERVNALVLVNGSHGHVFSTAFQPFVRVPFVGNASEFIVKTILRNNPKRTMEFVKTVLTLKPVDKVLTMVARLAGSSLMLDVHGESFINEWVHMYFGGLSGDDQSAASYCRLFQELHAHSVHHLLHLIEHPALLVSGGLDYLTPPYLMREMAREMKHAEYHCARFTTHLTLMEDPAFVVDRCDEFFRGLATGRKAERCGSVHFSAAQPAAAQPAAAQPAAAPPQL